LFIAAHTSTQEPTMLRTCIQLLAYLSMLFLFWVSLAGFLASNRFAYRPLILLGVGALLLALSAALEIGYPLFGWTEPLILFIALLGMAMGGLLLWWFNRRYQGIAPLRQRGITVRDMLFFKRAK
jgi:hypothetical protein